MGKAGSVEDRAFLTAMRLRGAKVYCALPGFADIVDEAVDLMETMANLCKSRQRRVKLFRDAIEEPALIDTVRRTGGNDLCARDIIKKQKLDNIEKVNYVIRALENQLASFGSENARLRREIHLYRELGRLPRGICMILKNGCRSRRIEGLDAGVVFAVKKDDAGTQRIHSYYIGQLPEELLPKVMYALVDMFRPIQCDEEDD